MKLVEILARELKEWPEGASHIVSALDGGIHQTRGGAPGHDQNDDVLPFTVLSGCGDEVFWNNRSVFWLSVAPDDYKTAIVTREMWQAAKDKLEGKVKAHKANKDGWIRHRGGKCPVEAGALVDVRFRSGITKTVCDSLSFRWDHTGQQGDIMAWRPHVATTEQSTEVAQTVVRKALRLNGKPSSQQIRSSGATASTLSTQSKRPQTKRTRPLPMPVLLSVRSWCRSWRERVWRCWTSAML